MIFEDWGLVDYAEGFSRQAALVDQIANGDEERVVFCTHPPVITLGRASLPEEVSGWDGPIEKVNRGGKATYHGPSQLVLYPFINLTQPHKGIPTRDVAAYLRALEQWVIDALGVFGLQARSIPTQEGSEQIYTGVWVGERRGERMEERKVASIGIAVRKWVTYHGCAINLVHDEKAFSGIQPCGFKPQVMSHLEKELGRKVTYDEMKQALISVFQW